MMCYSTVNFLALLLKGEALNLYMNSDMVVITALLMFLAPCDEASSHLLCFVFFLK